MNLSLVVLSIHENRQKTLGGFKAENRGNVRLFVCNFTVLLVDVHIIDLVERIYNFGVGNTQIPNNFGSALLMLFNLGCYHFNYYRNAI